MVPRPPATIVASASAAEARHHVVTPWGLERRRGRGVSEAEGVRDVFEAVGPSTGERGHEDDQRERDDEAAERERPHGARRRCGFACEELGSKASHGRDDQHRDDGLAEADEHVDARHGGKHGPPRDGVRRGELSRACDRGDDDRRPRGEPGGDEAGAWTLPEPPCHPRVDRRAHGGRDDGHVEQVRAQRREAAVLEEESLEDDDARHDHDGGERSEEDGGEGRADEVARGPGGDGEVQHLGREDERGRGAEQGVFARGERLAHAAQGDADARGRERGRGEGGLGVEEAVRDVHDEGSRVQPWGRAADVSVRRP